MSNWQPGMILSRDPGDRVWRQTFAHSLSDYLCLYQDHKEASVPETGADREAKAARLLRTKQTREKRLERERIKKEADLVRQQRQQERFTREAAHRATTRAEMRLLREVHLLPVLWAWQPAEVGETLFKGRGEVLETQPHPLPASMQEAAYRLYQFRVADRAVLVVVLWPHVQAPTSVLVNGCPAYLFCGRDEASCAAAAIAWWNGNTETEAYARYDRTSYFRPEEYQRIYIEEGVALSAKLLPFSPLWCSHAADDILHAECEPPYACVANKMFQGFRGLNALREHKRKKGESEQ